MSTDLFSLSAYEYLLPPELIAQYPAQPRDSSRLMVIEKSKGHIFEIPFREIVHYLNKHDLLIFNNTKVIPARLPGRRPTGGQAEVFLTNLRSDGSWEAMVRPGKKLDIGGIVHFAEDLSCRIIDILPDGRRVVSFIHEGDLEPLLAKYGQMPLPQYIRKGIEEDTDRQNYQTIYAEKTGAVAAPTAGLHFTEELLSKLEKKEVYQTFLTLHVGLGTFKPVQAEDIRDHRMHPEYFEISEESAQQLNSVKGAGRKVCVGTTSLRSVESAADEQGIVHSGKFRTDIFIYPGYRFKYASALLTNFHLPKSSLLMLVSAFGGYELIREAYSKAVREKFRFFSYGDAMLILE